MMRTISHVMLALLLTLSRSSLSASGANTRPNIVWIFADDHSYQTIGAYGGRLQSLNPTPNIDRLAKEGMRFDRCYVGNSICGPSRATLLTGKHSHKNGMLVNEGGHFDHNQPQFQKILRANGYQTALIGKIHLDGAMQGFDHWEVLPGQGEYNNPSFLSPAGRITETGYVTHIITEKSLNWLEHQRDPSRPFMLMIHHKAPHRTWIPAPEEMGRYEKISIPEPPNLFDDYSHRSFAAAHQQMTIANDMDLVTDLKVGTVGDKGRFPISQFAERTASFTAHPLSGKELVRWKYQQYMKDYLRCIRSVDEGVGKILDSLEKLNLQNNTIVMYSSDQGFYMGEHGWFDKRFMYEESFRTPLIARWPEHIEPGSVNMDLTQNIDFAETFLDLAGIAPPADMQGKSLLPLLKGKTPPDWRKSLYYRYEEYPFPHRVLPHEGVFDGTSKLIRFHGPATPGGEQWEYFNLKDDPSEMNNKIAAPESAQEVARMKQELSRLRILYDVPEDELISQ